MAVVRRQGKNARNVSQKIWLSAAEAEQVKAAAGGMPVATWLRDLALGRPLPTPPTKPPQQRVPKYAALVQPLAAAVARVGSNLNQIARAVNTDVKLRTPLEAVLIHGQLAQIQREIREELRTVNAKFLRELKQPVRKTIVEEVNLAGEDL